MCSLRDKTEWYFLKPHISNALQNEKCSVLHYTYGKIDLTNFHMKDFQLAVQATNPLT